MCLTPVLHISRYQTDLKIGKDKNRTITKILTKKRRIQMRPERQERYYIDAPEIESVPMKRSCKT